VGDLTGIIAILSLFVGLPAILLSFLYHSKKNRDKLQIEKLKYQKELMELEVKKLEAENRKYDNIINES
jgi:hypothetical protein